MSFPLLGCLLVNVVACEPERRQPPPPTDELSMHDVLALVESGGIASVDELLQALPDHHKQSFVFMETSASRHQSDVDHPRMILFGTDARFVVAVSSLPTDPLFDTVEMFELDEESGRFEFAAVSFGADGATIEGAAECTGCHGASPRPIWGAYPDWPGAFGPKDGDLTTDQAVSLAKLRLDPEHRFRFVAKWVSDDYMLTQRDYPYPNTNFNYELGARVASSLFVRLKASPEYERFAPALLAARECAYVEGDLAPELDAMFAEIAARAPRPEVLRSEERVLEILGLDVMTDWQLEVAVDQTSLGDGYDLTLWDAGSESLFGLVELLVLQDLMMRDSALADSFLPVASRIQQLYDFGWSLRGADRVAALAENDAYEYLDPTRSVFNALLGQSDEPTETREKVCGQLMRGF